MSKTWLAVSCFGSLLATSTVSRAQLTQSGALPAETERTQRSIAALVTAGGFVGFGAGLQLGAPQGGLRGALGWVPLFYAFEDPEKRQSRIQVVRWLSDLG